MWVLSAATAMLVWSQCECCLQPRLCWCGVNVSVACSHGYAGVESMWVLPAATVTLVWSQFECCLQPRLRWCGVNVSVVCSHGYADVESMWVLSAATVTLVWSQFECCLQPRLRWHTDVVKLWAVQAAANRRLLRCRLCEESERQQLLAQQVG